MDSDRDIAIDIADEINRAFRKKKNISRDLR
jgi:hypothetical protein